MIDENYWIESIFPNLKIDLHDGKSILDMVKDEPLKAKEILQARREALLKEFELRQQNVQVDPVSQKIIWETIADTRKYIEDKNVPSRILDGLEAATHAEEAIDLESKIALVQGAAAEAFLEIISEHLPMASEARKELAQKTAELSSKEKDLKMKERLLDDALSNIISGLQEIKSGGSESQSITNAENRIDELKTVKKNEDLILKKARELAAGGKLSSAPQSQAPESTSPAKAARQPTIFQRFGTQISTPAPSIPDDENPEPETSSLVP